MITFLNFSLQFDQLNCHMIHELTQHFAFLHLHNWIRYTQLVTKNKNKKEEEEEEEMCVQLYVMKCV